MTEAVQNTDTTNEVAAFKERVYTNATRWARGRGYESQVQQYLEELGIVPVLVFSSADDETVQSINSAVYAKLEELGRTEYADELGLLRPGTREVTVQVKVRLTPDEVAALIRQRPDEAVQVQGRRALVVEVRDEGDGTE